MNASQLAVAILEHPDLARAWAEKKRASDAKKSATTKRHKPRSKRAGSLARTARRTHTKSDRSRVRAVAAARAGDRCEACREWCPPERLHMDHFWGRAREESVESCWMLCPRCDTDKTENRPTRRAWLGGFSLHCERHGYAEQLTKIDRAMTLERAQRPTNGATP